SPLAGTHRDQVDPDRRRSHAQPLSGPAARKSLEPVQLVGCDRLVGRAVRIAGTGLDLTRHEDVAVSQHQVQLAVGAAPVALEHGHPEAAEIALGDSLAVRPDSLIAYSHHDAPDLQMHRASARAATAARRRETA